jgi:glycosyltransferase involved in cell wall biosynthesis
MTEKKIKIFTISDMPLSPSGVGIQTKNVIESLLKTGKFQVITFGGAIKHPKHDPIKTEEWGDDWVIFPVDGFGNPDMVRSVIRNHRPDLLWFMTDPRFFGWLWEIEDEIRSQIPMVYYHVWDNFPAPMYNAKFYNSTDVICAISKVTHAIVEEVAPEVESYYIPHAVDSEVFKPLGRIAAENLRKNQLEDSKDKFVFFWNNRNARRKQSGTLLYWFKEFLERVGEDKATLIMHTEPKDPNGQDLEHIAKELNMHENGQVFFSKEKYPPNVLAEIYNMVDCTVNISDAEGFGLATLESLSCGTPIIVNMTGGLQEQVTDGENWFGIGLEPVSKAVIGSQDIPYIYEDRLNKEEFIDALTTMLETSEEDRDKMGEAGREHVMKNYNFEDFIKRWPELLEDIHNRYGSWETRKGYKTWTFEEVG